MAYTITQAPTLPGFDTLPDEAKRGYEIVRGKYPAIRNWKDRGNTSICDRDYIINLSRRCLKDVVGYREEASITAICALMTAMQGEERDWVTEERMGRAWRYFHELDPDVQDRVLREHIERGKYNTEAVITCTTGMQDMIPGVQIPERIRFNQRSSAELATPRFSGTLKPAAFIAHHGLLLESPLLHASALNEVSEYDEPTIVTTSANYSVSPYGMNVAVEFSEPMTILYGIPGQGSVYFSDLISYPHDGWMQEALAYRDTAIEMRREWLDVVLPRAKQEILALASLIQERAAEIVAATVVDIEAYRKEWISMRATYTIDGHAW
jgi:hypothetical protein